MGSVFLRLTFDNARPLLSCDYLKTLQFSELICVVALDICSINFIGFLSSTNPTGKTLHQCDIFIFLPPTFWILMASCCWSPSHVLPWGCYVFLFFSSCSPTPRHRILVLVSRLMIFLDCQIPVCLLGCRFSWRDYANIVMAMKDEVCSNKFMVSMTYLRELLSSLNGTRTLFAIWCGSVFYLFIYLKKKFMVILLNL